MARDILNRKKIQLAAIDSGVSGHYYPEDIMGKAHDPKTSPICVRCGNSDVMNLLAEDILRFNNLSLET